VKLFLNKQRLELVAKAYQASKEGLSRSPSSNPHIPTVNLGYIGIAQRREILVGRFQDIPILKG
jgi:hypothetical protein